MAQEVSAAVKSDRLRRPPRPSRIGVPGLRLEDMEDGSESLAHDSVTHSPPSSSESNMKGTARHSDAALPRIRSRPRPQKMLHIDTSDPEFDLAMEFVSRGPLQDLVQKSNRADSLHARQRGRAIYLNDLLQFKSDEQAPGFQSALLRWKQSQGQDDSEETHNGEDVLEPDPTLLLAEARILAQSTDYPSGSSHRLLSPRQDAGQESYFERRIKRQSKKVTTTDLQTSASTPEGVLGKSSLPPAIDFREVNWGGSDDGIEVMNDSDAEDPTQVSMEEIEVLRAGLRFVIGCHDDLVKKKKSEALEHHPEHRTSSRDEAIAVPVRRSSTRRRSLMEALSIKGDPNGSSVASSTGHESVLDSDTGGLDQIAGPSNRYGMADVSALSSPTTEYRNPMDKARTRNTRRVSDAASLSSSWSRRPSRLETPSEKDEAEVANVSVSHSSLVSALQQMRRMDREKVQGQQSGLAMSTQSEIDEMVRQEKVKSAALLKELETLKSALCRLERQSTEAAGLSDFERGARSDDEAMMMEAVAQAARDTVEAEERAAGLKDECEVLTERINVLEDALFQAMGLLAEKENSEAVQLHQTVEPIQTAEAIPPTFTSLSIAEGDDRTSGSSSPFYSAGEDDNDFVESTPFAAPSRPTESSFADTLKQYSLGGSDAQPFSALPGEYRVDRFNSQRGSIASGWDRSTVMSDDETLYDRKQSIASKIGSPRSSVSESRRESHASWVRHSNMPSHTSVPLHGLPELPTMNKMDQAPIHAEIRSVDSRPSLDVVEPDGEDNTTPMRRKLSSRDAKIVDYPTRTRRKRSDTVPRVKTVEEEVSASPLALGHVSLSSDVKSAPSVDEKEMPSLPSGFSFQVDDAYDSKAAPDMTAESWRPSNTRSSTSNSMTKLGRTMSVGTTSSQSSSIKNVRPKLGNSKGSILGNMPPAYSESPSSPASAHAIDIQPSSVSNGIAEHYEKLARDRSGANKMPPNPTIFARRTRFSATATAT